MNSGCVGRVNIELVKAEFDKRGSGCWEVHTRITLLCCDADGFTLCEDALNSEWTTIKTTETVASDCLFRTLPFTVSSSFLPVHSKL